MSAITDLDGNVIRKGMAVVSLNEIWVVGSIHGGMVRLDRDRKSLLLGRRNLRLIHIIGYQIPLVF